MLPLYLASVVPSQTAVWQTYPDVHVITLDQVPLQGVYPTLGIDRALAWGAGETWGWPMLVIDAGTALTLTGADADHCLVGEQFYGVGLQLQSLAQRTGGLPLVEIGDVSTSALGFEYNRGIQSGVIYTIIAGIRDFIQVWRQEFQELYYSDWGDSLLLMYLQSQFPR